MRDSGINCYNYLDDVICITETLKEGVEPQQVIINVLRDLRFYISWGKVTTPSRNCTYLGLNIDMIKMRVSLPLDKIDKLRKELMFWSGRVKATKKQLQVLIGYVGHCSRVVQGGKLYMHHLFAKLTESLGKKRLIAIPHLQIQILIAF